jgi:tetratricopeptide (TPR) repeat protein
VNSPAAEEAYLFRHALLRDAAYQLQLPGDRAALHALALGIIEEIHGGRAPEPPDLTVDGSKCDPHPVDAVAVELAEHARFAEATGENVEESRAARRRYLRRGAEVSERHFRHEAAQGCWEQLAAMTAGAPRGVALHLAGVAASRRSRLKESESLMQEATTLLLDSSAQRPAARALGSLANFYFQCGREADAERTAEQALAIHRAVGERRNEGIALGNLANVYSRTGRIEQAERTMKRAIEIAREVGNRRSEGIVLTSLASVCRDTGRTGEAERAFAEAIAIHREVGNRRNEGIAQGNLANLYLETGRVSLAAETCESALAIHRTLGNRRFEGVHLCGLALIQLAQGKPVEARATWQSGTGLLRQLNDTQALKSVAEEMRSTCGKTGLPPFETPSPTYT